MKSLSCVRLFVTLWTIAYQAHSSMGFSRQEYWSRLSFPSLGDLPYPGIKQGCPTLQADALPSESPGKSCFILEVLNYGFLTGWYVYIIVRYITNYLFFSQFSCLVMSNSLQPHGPQHAMPPCPSSTPRVYSNSDSLSLWCHPTISSSVIPFSSHFQSFPESGYFQMSQLVKSGGQSIGFSASTSLLPMNIQDWFPSGWTGWVSLLFKGLSSLQHHSSKASILCNWVFSMVQLSRSYMTNGKS